MCACEGAWDCDRVDSLFPPRCTSSFGIRVDRSGDYRNACWFQTILRVAQRSLFWKRLTRCGSIDTCIKAVSWPRPNLRQPPLRRTGTNICSFVFALVRTSPTSRFLSTTLAVLLLIRSILIIIRIPVAFISLLLSVTAFLQSSSLFSSSSSCLSSLLSCSFSTCLRSIRSQRRSTATRCRPHRRREVASGAPHGQSKMTGS